MFTAETDSGREIDVKFTEVYNGTTHALLLALLRYDTSTLKATGSSCTGKGSCSVI